MKALVYEGPRSLVHKNVPDPAPGEGDALIEVKCAGICGSDMHAYLGHDERRPAPLILGHEISGLVIGGGLKGKRVAVNPLVTCQVCEFCRQGRENLCPERQIISMPPREGGFAELLAIPERNLAILPEDATYEQAALIEPLACSRHAAQAALSETARDPENAKTLVIGGGAIGFGTALALMEMKAGKIVLAETNDARRRFLESLGRNEIDIRSAPGEKNFDAVVDCAGFGPTRRIACECVKSGGTVAHVGLGDNSPGLDARDMTLRGVVFKGIYTYTAAGFLDTAKAAFEGATGELNWHQTRRLSEGSRAFRDILAGKTECPKIILKPD